MHQEQQMAVDNSILEIRVGSHLYGTNTPTSDEDFAGIFVATPEYYFGLKHIEEVDMSVVSKLSNGRNASDAIDKKYYELRKFVKLAMQNNPNIIEMLFVGHNNIVSSTPVGWTLINNAHLFPYKGCKERFIGYAFSQKKKMVIKRDNMLSIVEAIDYINNNVEGTECVKKKHVLVNEIEQDLVDHLKSKGLTAKINNQHILVGDLFLQRNVTMKKAVQTLSARVEKFSNRKELVDEYGYDTKFASHLIRLLSEGIYLLKHGQLDFPMHDTQLIRDIKAGEFKLNEIIDMAEEYEDKTRLAYDLSSLPLKPRYDEINLLLMDMVYDHLDIQHARSN